MNPTSHPLLDVAHCVRDESPVLYYSIGAEQVNQAELISYVEKLRERGLEIVRADPEYKQELSLSERFDGYLIFVQKHSEDDPDHTAGQPLGSDVLEVLEMVNTVAREMFNGSVPLSPSAHHNMQSFVQRFGDFLFVYPAFNDIDKALDELRLLKEQSDIQASND